MSQTLPFPPRHLVEADTATMLREQRADDEAVARDAVWDAEPPDAKELKVDVRDLLPQHARLVRFEAWQQDLKKRLEKLQAGRAAYLESLGVVTRTEARIAEIVKADQSGLLEAMRKGGEFSAPKMRTIERSQLEARLPADRHEAEMAKGALDAAEREIEAIQKQIQVLAGRREKFVFDAVLEYAAAEGVGPEYMAAVEQVQELIAKLLGLAHVLGQHRGYYRNFREEIVADVAMPRFNLPGVAGYIGDTINAGALSGPKIVVSADRARKAAQPWAELAKAWMTDARHQPAVAPTPKTKGKFFK